MSFEIQSRKVNFGDSANFAFDNPVLSCVPVFQNARYHYTDDDHHVRNISAHLTANKVNQQNVNISLSGNMHDDSGHVAEGHAHVVVLAWTGTKRSGGVVLDTERSYPSGQKSESISLPDQPLSVSQALLSGFHLAYGRDNHIRDIRMVVGASEASHVRKAFLTGTADFWDSSGNHAKKATLDGSYVGVSENSGLLTEVVKFDNASQEKTVQFDHPIQGSPAAVCMSFKLWYGGGDHHVAELKFGANDVVREGKSKVTVKPSLLMRDVNGNHKASGHQQMLVLATPA